MERVYKDLPYRTDLVISITNVYKKAAYQGHIEAQYKLGEFYEAGKGIEKNYTEAFYWYKKAFYYFEELAKRGDVKAQYRVGLYYEFGKGVEKSYKKAFKWYDMAADFDNENKKNSFRFFAMLFSGNISGNKEAQYKLGEFYEKGKEVKKDMKESCQTRTC